MESSQTLLRLGHIRATRGRRGIDSSLSSAIRNTPSPRRRHVLPVLLLPIPAILHLRNIRILLDCQMVNLPMERGWGYRGRYWRYQDQSYYIIRERYAKGEITKEQLEQMMRDLQQHGTNQL